MVIETQTQNISLLWGSLRNLIDWSSLSTTDEFPGIALIGEELGIFPIDSYQQLFLEIAKDNRKLDLSGRKNIYYNRPSISDKWSKRRIIKLPTYLQDRPISLRRLKEISELWDYYFIPSDLPFLAVATVIKGDQTSEGRLAQHGVVLTINSNLTGRIFEIEWFEGPEEDCITPEWYVRSSELLSMDQAILKVKKLHQLKSRLKRPLYAISTIPSSLDIPIEGEIKEHTTKYWKIEHTYFDFLNFQGDLYNLLDLISKQIGDDI